jgi:hypothetical protein
MARLLTACLFLVCFTAAATAQPREPAGRIAGTITDRSGGVIPAAQVEIRGLDDSQVVRQSAADAEGRFTLGDLPPGRYSARVAAADFHPVVRVVDVAAATTARIDVVLDIAPSAVRVEVTAHGTSQPLRVETDPQQPRQPLPAQDGAEYLKTIPGFAVIRKGGTDGDPILRGMAGSRLGILLDGQNLLGGCSAHESADRLRLPRCLRSDHGAERPAVSRARPGELRRRGALRA